MKKGYILIAFLMITACGQAPEPWKVAEPMGDFYLGDGWDVQSNTIAMLIVSNHAGIDQWVSRTHITTNIELQRYPGEELEFIRVSFPEAYADNIRRLTLYYYESEPLTNKFLVKMIAELLSGMDMETLLSEQTNLTNLGASSTESEGDVTNRYYLQRRESRVDISTTYYKKDDQYLFPKLIYDYPDFLAYLKSIETNLTSVEE